MFNGSILFFVFNVQWWKMGGKLTFFTLKNAKNQGFMRVNAVIHSQCFVLGNRSTGWTFSVR